nr:MAG TPA: Single strand binding protein [Caudoviricetes sp.]
MNKVALIGNLTKDPELAETSSGIAYTNLSVAVSRPFVNEDGERATDFFNVTVWRTQAENCVKYLTKGKKVSIIARLQNRTYEDKNGNKRYVNDIIAEEVEFLSPSDKSSEEYQRPSECASKASKPQLEEVQEELPF